MEETISGLKSERLNLKQTVERLNSELNTSIPSFEEEIRELKQEIIEARNECMEKEEAAA